MRCTAFVHLSVCVIVLTSGQACGPSVSREADCIDELCLTLSPVLENGNAGRIVAGAAQTTRSMQLGHAISVGDMLMLRYERAATATANASAERTPS